MARKRKKPETPIPYEIVEEEASEQINYSYILLLQINRINEALWRGMGGAFRRGVEALEIMLTPYLEKGKYKKRMQEINAWYKAEYLKMKGKSRIVDGNQASRLEFYRTKRKYKALMIVIEKAGLLPPEEISL